MRPRPIETEMLNCQDTDIQQVRLETDLIEPSSQSCNTSVSSDFMVLCVFFLNYTYFTLPCRELGLV